MLALIIFTKQLSVYSRITLNYVELAGLHRIPMQIAQVFSVEGLKHPRKFPSAGQRSSSALQQLTAVQRLRYSPQLLGSATRITVQNRKFTIQRKKAARRPPDTCGGVWADLDDAVLCFLSPSLHDNHNTLWSMDDIVETTTAGASR
jgi:hypothetical protein